MWCSQEGSSNMVSLRREVKQPINCRVDALKPSGSVVVFPSSQRNHELAPLFCTAQMIHLHLCGPPCGAALFHGFITVHVRHGCNTSNLKLRPPIEKECLKGTTLKPPTEAHGVRPPPRVVEERGHKRVRAHTLLADPGHSLRCEQLLTKPGSWGGVLQLKC